MTSIAEEIRAEVATMAEKPKRKGPGRAQRAHVAPAKAKAGKMAKAAKKLPKAQKRANLRIGPSALMKRANACGPGTAYQFHLLRSARMLRGPTSASKPEITSKSSSSMLP